ncbi:hypothetical protein ACIQ9J_21615 [Streptomyces sp. NPDC094153]|uniref:hypothetical protein n=1 Tax=Streptomyces sp. NPDC094153 TaxID=3366058 RepID=UPI00380B0ED4
MTCVIVAGALGVILITGGLFLQRLLGNLAQLRRQVAECRRQISEIDRQMRAQRAHMTILRQLLADEGSDGEPPSQPAVVNGHDTSTLPEPYQPMGLQPVRRKRHLWLYLGGAAAALTAAGTATIELGRAQRAQFLGTMVAAAAVTAATVTFAVQPWTADSADEPPAAAPTASTPPTDTPLSSYLPTPPAVAPPAPSQSPQTALAEPSDGPSASADTDSLTPGPDPAVTVQPVDDEVPADEAVPPPGGGQAEEADTAAPAPPPAGIPSPAASDEHRPEVPPSPPPPSGMDSARPELCLRLKVPALTSTGTCLLNG